jgi:hypothetical protein
LKYGKLGIFEVNEEIPSMQGTISMAAAKLNDAFAVERLVSATPDADRLRTVLKPGFSGAIDAYHAGTRTARYIRADADLVVCFILTDVSQQEAQAVGDALRHARDLGYAAFEAAVHSVIKAQTIRVKSETQ